MKSWNGLIIFTIALNVLAESYSHPVQSYVNDLPRRREERSASPEPQGSWGSWPVGGYRGLGGQYNFNNDHASIGGRAGILAPNDRVVPTFGVQGSYQLPRGTLSATWDKIPIGSTTGLQYKHEVYNNPRGSLHVIAGAQKSTGQPLQGQVGLQLTY